MVLGLSNTEVIGDLDQEYFLMEKQRQEPGIQQKSLGEEVETSYTGNYPQELCLTKAKGEE